MKTIAIANQKGGTGKTTTAYNLGIALTQQGYRVLMVDFDPQGNLSCYCGIPPEQDLEQTITELLMKVAYEKPLSNAFIRASARMTLHHRWISSHPISGWLALSWQWAP